MRRLRPVHKDEHGSISVEFVVLLSMYAFIVVAVFSFIEVYVASTKAYKANALVANVVSRHTKMDAVTFDQATTLYRVMTDSSSTQMTVRMTLLRNVGGTPEIQWSVNSESLDNCIEADYPLIAERFPDLPPGSEIILLETTTKHTPLFDASPIGIITLAQDSIFIPRFSANLVVDTDNNPPKYVCDYAEGIYNEEGGDDDLNL